MTTLRSSRLLAALFALSLMCTLQWVNISFAHAAPGSADLSITWDGSVPGYLGQVSIATICNEGDETVTGFTLDPQMNNYNITGIIVSIEHPNTTASTPGSMNETTYVWTGVLNNGECIAVGALGQFTAPVGQQVTGTLAITTSTLSGNIDNDDPNDTNDVANVIPIDIVLLPDLALDARLLTTGPIVSGTEVHYELIVSNVGEGPHPNTGTMILPVVLPDAASGFVSLTDLDTGVLSVSGCTSYGPTSNLNAATGAAHPGTAMVCELAMSGDFVAGATARFELTINATDDFISDGVSFIAMIAGNDYESIYFQGDVITGKDAFGRSINNVKPLTYNSNELQTTVNRCPGQAATTTDGTGCFRITFNKLIYAPSFTQSDVVLSNGIITSFQQLDDFTWEVRFSGLTPGQSVQLTLAHDSVLDYSAVMNGVSVLGENTIRYDVQGTTAGVSSLPATGAHSAHTETIAGTILLLLGFALTRVMKKRHAVVHTSSH